jgi:FtsH-binding integral membrane protein
MKAALYGLRKLLVFVLSLIVVFVGLIFALRAATGSGEVALQIAAIFASFCGVITFTVRAVYDAFKGGYERDAAIEVAKVQAAPPPPASVPPSNP